MLLGSPVQQWNAMCRGASLLHSSHLTRLIPDYLRKYTWDKRLETIGKSVKTKPYAISTVDTDHRCHPLSSLTSEIILQAHCLARDQPSSHPMSEPNVAFFHCMNEWLHLSTAVILFVGEMTRFCSYQKRFCRQIQE
jgi:hypothetical protein